MMRFLNLSFLSFTAVKCIIIWVRSVHSRPIHYNVNKILNHIEFLSVKS